MATERRLIDANEAERKRLAARLKQYHDWKFTPGVYEHSIFGLAAKLLEVDAVEVVRCEKCRYYEKAEYDDGYKMVCRLLKRQTAHNDFCSYGERRTDNA